MCFKLENFPIGGERLGANVKAIFKNEKGCFEKEALELVCVSWEGSLERAISAHYQETF